MYLEPLVLVGRGLVLGELTFKNRGQFGSRFFWIGFSWFFLNAELQPLANWQRWLNLSDYFFSMRWGPTLCFLAIKSEGTNRPQDSSEVPTTAVCARNAQLSCGRCWASWNWRAMWATCLTVSQRCAPWGFFKQITWSKDFFRRNEKTNSLVPRRLGDDPFWFWVSAYFQEGLLGRVL